MSKKIVIILGVIIVLLGVTGFMVYKVLTKPIEKTAAPEASQDITIPEVDKSVVINAKSSSAKSDTVTLSVSGMASKMTTLNYELSYEYKGMVKGVNSGSKPIDVVSQDTFSRDVYLGTCSKNVCTPDAGVKKVTVVIEFTDVSGNKSQSSKDFEL
jgi:hypothetical protein